MERGINTLQEERGRGKKRSSMACLSAVNQSAKFENLSNVSAVNLSKLASCQINQEARARCAVRK